MTATETLVATGNQAHSHGPGSPVPLQARRDRVVVDVEGARRVQMARYSVAGLDCSSDIRDDCQGS